MILRVTFESLLTARRKADYCFRERIRTLLRQNQNLHEELLRNHPGKHVNMLLNF
ncbi:MAG: hypothetical protein JRF71_15610 [Deltaproteobacteria bacterium]|nr:hypothetical protein [Deltaproteobacteria bacterium]MBW2202228.1 hypothetical protein [Deltaproteobacteria bacterium]